ncbi:AAA family ATPase [Lysinibacillus sp. BF-4]|uniref:AAA family ATPase n=1 Tax=Lysinibacillus sp. BF-4 TaxID=1473546 RepID=UPI00068EE4E2|nr:AAA family ATPase [Lysinibacillus sp. BF-4]
MTKPNVVIMAGATGVGKSFIGQLIARKKGYSYIDKDTATRPFVERYLAACSPTQDSHDRESDFYIQKVRPLEYETILQLVQDNIALGQSVVVTAGFEQELDDATYLHSNPQMQALCAQATIIVVKVTVDSPTLLTRLIKRNDPRDKGKLSNWDAYVKEVEGLRIAWDSADFTQLGFDNSDMLPVLYELKVQSLIQSIS